jgi:quercetin dioxygenase-like cupin family protein
MESNLFEAGNVFSFTDTIEYSPEGIVSKRVLQKESGNITLFAFDKDQKLSEHTAPFDAMVQVLDGEVEIIIGGKVNHLKPGMNIIMPAGIPHAVNAITRFRMLLTMIKSN